MIPVVTPEEMAAIDAAAPEPVEVLIERAGAQVALAAVRLLGGTYGRRVVVVAGKGNNGADGKAAAARLQRKGVRVVVIEAADAPATLPACDLVIDAAYGTGFHGSYDAPDADGAPVLAVDIPSGVDGLTGAAGGTPLRATATITFAALKPGLLFGDGPSLAGDVEVVDIGLDTSGSRAGVIEPRDAGRWLPHRSRDAHKWQAALYVCAGSPGMTGAAALVTEAAMRAGAGLIRVGSPGADDLVLPVEALRDSLPAAGFDGAVLDQLDRYGALVLGPGLGTSQATSNTIRRIASAAPVPLVIDADGLTALGDRAGEVLVGREHATVLTPHDGEMRRLTGDAVGADRIAAARALAASTGAVVLLKGPSTVIARPDGQVRISTAGDARLATAGSGDVLSGILGAFLAAGAGPFDAAAAAAMVHGTAARRGPRRGLVASDLIEALPGAIDEVGAA
jgi:NAD(P)H-hydrate epimerase